MSTELAEPPVGAPTFTARLSRWLGLGILVLLAVLAVEVLLEAWVQELLGDRFVIPDDKLHRLGGTVPDWPKTLKNGLLVLLVAASLGKITIERRWRDFTTRADLAIVVLGAIMVLAGLVGTS